MCVVLSRRRKSAGGALRRSNFFFRRQFACFFLEHDRNVVTYRVGQSTRAANELRLTLAVDERTLAHRANQNVEQFRVQVQCPGLVSDGGIDLADDQLHECLVDAGIDRERPPVIASKARTFYRILLRHEHRVGLCEVEILRAEFMMVRKGMRYE